MNVIDYRSGDGLDIDELADRNTTLLAGGTDLLPLMKLGLHPGGTVVDVKTSSLDASITRTASGSWRIGGLATLADLERDPLADALPVVAQAARSAATRQIRNRATVAGNLLQRSRCAYYRDPSIQCWLQGGDECPARSGRNEHHAIHDTGTCVTTHPSDLANALVALGATLETTAGDLAVEALLTAPTEADRRLASLPGGAVIEAIRIPDPGPGVRSAYVKAMDRAAWSFALVGVAAVVALDEAGRVSSARLVAGGVASHPWSMPEVGDGLVGHPLDDDVVAEAARRAGSGATPLDENGYKVDLLRGLTRRVLLDCRAS